MTNYTHSCGDCRFYSPYYPNAGDHDSGRCLLVDILRQMDYAHPKLPERSVEPPSLSTTMDNPCIFGMTRQEMETADKLTSEQLARIFNRRATIVGPISSKDILPGAYADTLRLTSGNPVKIAE